MGRDQLPPSPPGAQRPGPPVPPPPLPLPAAGWQAVLSLHLGQSRGDTPVCAPRSRVSPSSGCSAAVTVVPCPLLSPPCDCLSSFCSF